MSSASTSPPFYSSILKSTPGPLSRSSSISRSGSNTSLSSSTSSFSPQSYLTVHDLYMHYAPLKSLTKATLQVSLSKLLPPMKLKDLFNKFAPKMGATPSDPPTPPPPQDAGKAPEEPPAKTPPSTVDKQGRDVTKTGMKNTTDKPSPIYQRCRTFPPPGRYDTLTSFGLAQNDYKCISQPDENKCAECTRYWAHLVRCESRDVIRAMHKKLCLFWRKHPDPW